MMAVDLQSPFISLVWETETVKPEDSKLQINLHCNKGIQRIDNQQVIAFDFDHKESQLIQLSPSDRGNTNSANFSTFENETTWV